MARASTVSVGCPVLPAVPQDSRPKDSTAYDQGDDRQQERGPAGGGQLSSARGSSGAPARRDQPYAGDVEGEGVYAGNPHPFDGDPLAREGPQVHEPAYQVVGRAGRLVSQPELGVGSGSSSSTGPTNTPVAVSVVGPGCWANAGSAATVATIADLARPLGVSRQRVYALREG